MSKSNLTPYNWSVDVERLLMTMLDEEDLQSSERCPSNGEVVSLERSSEFAIPDSEQNDVNKPPISDSAIRCSSNIFEKFDLMKYGITLLDSSADLLNNGFEELPLKLGHKEVIITKECIAYPKYWEAYQNRLTELSAQSKANITVKFGALNSTAVFTEVGSVDWKYLWYPTHATIATLNSARLSLGDDGSTRSEDCLIKYEGEILRSMFFNADTNNHLLLNLMCDDMPLLKPNCTAGPFYYSRVSKSVKSAIHTPDLEETAKFLTVFHSIAGEHLGTAVNPLPIFIGEHKQDEETNKDSVSKLLVEMRYTREMMELVWEEAPKFNFGYFVDHSEWHIFAMRRNQDGQLFATKIFQHRATNYLDKAYIVTVLNQLAVFIHDQLLGVKMIPESQRYKLILQLNQIVGRRTAQVKDNQPPVKLYEHKAMQFYVIEDIADNVQIVSCDNQILVRKTGPRDSIKLEAKRLKVLKGPYVVPLVWLKRSGKCYALATPRYDEVPRPTSVKETVRLSKQLLTALSSLHEVSYLHGDVKLNNIVYDMEHHRVRFIDLETARQFLSGQKSKFYCGTKTFMAPEMLKREVFSMGLVLACLIYNKKIANKQDRADLLSAVQSLQTSPLATPSLIELVREMVQENSAQRISAADALSVCQKIEASLNQRPQPKIAAKTKAVEASASALQARRPLAPVSGTRQAIQSASGVGQVTKQTYVIDENSGFATNARPVVRK